MMSPETPASPKSLFASPPRLPCVLYADRLEFFMRKFTVLSLTSFLLLAGCNSAPPAPAVPAVDIAAEQGKIRDLESAWADAALAKDLEKSVSFYADDAILLNAGVPAAKGKDAIHAAWKDMLADPNSKLVFAANRVDVSSSGRHGQHRGFVYHDHDESQDQEARRGQRHVHHGVQEAG